MELYDVTPDQIIVGIAIEQIVTCASIKNIIAQITIQNVIASQSKSLIIGNVAGIGLAQGRTSPGDKVVGKVGIGQAGFSIMGKMD